MEAPCTIMAKALCDGLLLLEQTIGYAFDVRLSDSVLSKPTLPTLESYTTNRKRICDSVRLMKMQLGVVQAALERRRKSLKHNAADVDDFSKEVFGVSLFTVSLLQLAADITTALNVGQRIVEKLSARNRRRLWLPKITRDWFRENTAVTKYDVDDFNIEQFARDLPDGYSAEEDREIDEAVEEEAEEAQGPSGAQPSSPSSSITCRGLESDNLKPTSKECDVADEKTSVKSGKLFQYLKCLRASAGRQARSHLTWFFQSPKQIWASLVKPRRHWSKVLRNLKHSRHLQYGLKNAIGIAFLSLPAFLLPSQGAAWFQRMHGQWAVVTYIFVLETNTGATVRAGGLRLIGTVCGAIFAYVAWEICHQNPFGIVAMFTLSELPISWLVVQTSVSPIGIVASVTIPPVLFTNLDRTAAQSTFKLAIIRATCISVGIIAAVLMNHFVYPRHCRRIFLYQASKTLSHISQLYLQLSRQITSDHPSRSSATRRIIKLESEIREYIFRMNALIGIMHLEVSLLPKPLRTYRRLTTVLHRSLNILVGLRRVRDHIPQKETVKDVLQFRHEVISCVCITLFACETTFRTGHRLPQFLPSPQHALDALIREKEHSIQLQSALTRIHPHHVTLNEGSISPGVTPPKQFRRPLSLSFALAENALLEEFVSTLEELLDIGRRLHGVEEWLTPDPTEHSHEEDDIGMASHHYASLGGVDTRSVLSTLNGTASSSPIERPRLTSGSSSPGTPSTRIPRTTSSDGYWDAGRRSRPASRTNTPQLSPRSSSPTGSLHGWI